MVVEGRRKCGGSILSAVEGSERLGCEGGDIRGIGNDDKVLEVFVTVFILFSVNDVED